MLRFMPADKATIDYNQGEKKNQKNTTQNKTTKKILNFM